MSDLGDAEHSRRRRMRPAVLVAIVGASALAIIGLVAIGLVAIGGGIWATDSAGDAEAVDQCSKPVGERTGGWLCPENAP